MTDCLYGSLACVRRAPARLFRHSSLRPRFPAAAPPSSICAASERASCSLVAVDCPGLLFHKLRLVAALFGSSVALKHPREEAKRQMLIDSVQAPFESMLWLAGSYGYVASGYIIATLRTGSDSTVEKLNIQLCASLTQILKNGQ